MAILDAQSASTRRRGVIIVALAVPTVVLVALGLGAGTTGTGIWDNWANFWHAAWEMTLGGGRDALTTQQKILWDLRAPRVLTAVVAGIGLSVAGLILQAVLRNPLASPFTLGVSSAASFGAALVIILHTGVFTIAGWAVPNDLVVGLNAFVFAVAAMLVVYAMTRFQQVTPETIVLLGVAMMFLFDAATALVQYLGRPEEVAQLAYWLFGSLTKTTWSKLAVMAIVVAVTVVLAKRWVWDLNTMLGDDESARSVGTDVEAIRLRGLLLASVVTAVIVAVLGPVAFIGLVAPHLAQMLVGGDHRFLLPASCLIGASTLTAADVVSRTIADPVVIPVGILTSFLGVPLLIWLVMRRRVEHW